ncbi:MAG TPA: CsbD family protein [Bryobacteraceae bacterium]|nr:CsbD family protein [Bryobacteraceae bacterium]
MNWDEIEGNWKQFKGHAREKWAKLTDSDWESLAGKKDKLVGRIQERYGYNKEQAEREVDEWSRGLAAHSHR